MKKQKKSGFMEWNNSVLVNSLKKINFNIFIIIILDILFYASAGYLFLFWLQRLQARMAAFNMPTDIISLGIERAQQAVSEVKAFYYLIIFSFVLVLIAVIFLASIFKGLIWAKTTGARISFRLVSGFLLLNLIWMGFWFAVVFLISYAGEPAFAPVLMASVIILSLYFTNTLYTIFMKTQSLQSAFGAIKANVAKFHLFLLPYSIIFLLLYAIIRLGTLVKFKYSIILLGLAIIVYAAVVRYYTSALVLEIEKPKNRKAYKYHI